MRLITLIKYEHRANPEYMPWVEVAFDRCTCDLQQGAHFEATRTPEGVRLVVVPSPRSHYFPAFDATHPTYLEALHAFEDAITQAANQNPDLQQETLWRLQFRTQYENIKKTGTKRQIDQAVKVVRALNAGELSFEEANARLAQITKRGW